MVYSDQSYGTGKTFPSDYIDQKWKAGYHITHLAYGDGIWSVVMSKGSGLNAQIWRTKENFPNEIIKEKWEEGYEITNLVYGNGVWALVMSKGSKYTLQTLLTDKKFPQKTINKKWNDGFDITDVTFGNGVWVLVMSQGTGFSTQSWRTRNEFPEKEIKKCWDDGYDITNLVYGNGVWALVISKGTDFTTQSWSTRTNFPKDVIKDKWDNGFDITGISYGKDLWALVISKGKKAQSSGRGVGKAGIGLSKKKTQKIDIEEHETAEGLIKIYGKSYGKKALLDFLKEKLAKRGLLDSSGGNIYEARDANLFVMSPESFQAIIDNYKIRRKYTAESFDCDDFARVFFSEAVQMVTYDDKSGLGIAECFINYDGGAHALNMIPVYTPGRVDIMIFEPQNKTVFTLEQAAQHYKDMKVYRISF